jgi:hypothetical protein
LQRKTNARAFADDLVLGDVEEDHITISQQTFGRCNQIAKEMLEYDSSGLVGLGFNYRSSSADFPTLIENLIHSEVV